MGPEESPPNSLGPCLHPASVQGQPGRKKFKAQGTAIVCHVLLNYYYYSNWLLILNHSALKDVQGV